MAILNNLIVNGASRFLNKAYFDTLEADTGRFNKLATKVLGSDGTTITVHGLMDVQGELHTKSWTNSNIATIDGSFYICPTLKVTETGSTTNGLTITQSSGTWSVQITSSSAVVTNSVYTMDSSGTVTSTGTWSLGSKVAITGEILINNEWIPLGTLRGRLTQRSSDLKSITISSITDGSSSSNNILNTIGPQSNVKHRNVKISLYEWTLSDSSTPITATTNPIGIYMTALGDGTGQTMIDIYGGQESAGTTYKGLAKPYVRIGNLSGLSSLTVGGQNPKGWGIYTSNGYFEGTIAARRGYIGNNTKYWTIGTSGTNSTIFSGPTTVSATGTAGTYLGTDGFLNTASASVYAQITNGILTAKGVDITGKITASSGSIAGWRIESSYLASGSATAPATNVLLLSPSGTTNSYTVAGQAKTGWMITAGTTFGVNKDGGIYATSGKIGGWDITASSIQTGAYNTTGKMYFGTSGLSLGTTFRVTSAGALTATSGTIGGWNISASALCSATTYAPATNRILLAPAGVTTTSATGNLPAATYAITAGTDFGVTMAGKLYATGVEIKGNIAATEGFTVTKTINNTQQTLTTINTDGLTLYDGTGINDSDILAKFLSSGMQIGYIDNSHLLLDFHSLVLKDKQQNEYLKVIDRRELNGYAQIVETYYGDGETKEFKSPIGWGNESLTVQVNDTTISSGYSTTNSAVTFSTAPIKDDKISLIFSSNSDIIKDFTFGRRSTNSNYGPLSASFGNYNEASGHAAFAEGSSTTASGSSSHAEGYSGTASGNSSHAEGYDTTASGKFSHAEGHNTTASGENSHAEGWSTTASGKSSHAEGISSVASEGYSHAEGYYTTASGERSHAEGSNTKASKFSSHAEGHGTTASENYSHAEGYYTTASGVGSHAEGRETIAKGDYSHAQNYYTVATGSSQTVIGKYNKATVTGSGTESSPYVYTNVGDYAFIIGNGTANTTAARSNALTIDWNGNIDLPTGKFSGVGATLTYDASNSGTNALEINNASSNVLTVDWDGQIGSPTTAVASTTITTFTSGWGVYNSDQQVILRRYGRVVSLTGALKNTASKTLNTTDTAVFTLPTDWTEYWPKQLISCVGHGSGANKFLFRIHPSDSDYPGVVTFARYTNGTSYSSITTGSWFPFHVTWIA